MKTLVGAVMVIGMVAGIGMRAHGATPAQAPDPKLVEAGKAVYAAQNCKTCHMIDKAGGKMASSLDGVGSKLKADEIRKWFTATAEMEAKLPKKPSASMAAWIKTKKLSDADVNGLVAYMSSLK
jgi:mono/diheme cytochrome c family protein